MTKMEALNLIYGFIYYASIAMIVGAVCITLSVYSLFGFWHIGSTFTAYWLYTFIIGGMVAGILALSE